MAASGMEAMRLNTAKIRGTATTRLRLAGANPRESHQN
jgi:hypothetical protein